MLGASSLIFVKREMTVAVASSFGFYDLKTTATPWPRTKATSLTTPPDTEADPKPEEPSGTQVRGG